MKFLLSIVFMLTCTFVYSQANVEEVVYLKNGSILRGTIIEQVPNETLKIQTKDGSVFVCKYTEVEKITKEKVFISPYYNTVNANLKAKMQNYKSSGIGLTTTAGVLLVTGSAMFAGVRNGNYYGAGRYITGITFLCMSTAFIVSGPIMLSKYKKAKAELESQKSLSFYPSINKHHTDGIVTNASSAFTSYGIGVKFTF